MQQTMPKLMFIVSHAIQKHTVWKELCDRGVRFYPSGLFVPVLFHLDLSSCVHMQSLQSMADAYQIHTGCVMCVCSVCVSMWNLRCLAGSVPTGQSYDEQLSTRATL